MNIAKPFLTYEQQIQKLKNKNLIISNENYAIEKLKECSYYSLINGYKELFKTKNKNYKTGTTFENIVELYNFDLELRTLLLKHILIIERHIKSLYSYHFCQMYGDDQSAYNNVLNYDYKNHQSDVNDLVNVFSRVRNSDYPYIKYNLTKYNQIPMWVILQGFTFGELSKLFLYSKPKLQSLICKEFKNIYPADMNAMLKLVTQFRNKCAHNERVYNYHPRNSIKTTYLHKNFNLYNKKNNPYGTRDIFALIIIFKHLLSSDYYAIFSSSFSNILDNFFTDNLNLKKQVMKNMGFPDTWDAIKLSILK